MKCPLKGKKSKNRNGHTSGLDKWQINDKKICIKCYEMPGAETAELTNKNAHFCEH